MPSRAHAVYFAIALRFSKAYLARVRASYVTTLSVECTSLVSGRRDLDQRRRLAAARCYRKTTARQLLTPAPNNNANYSKRGIQRVSVPHCRRLTAPRPAPCVLLPLLTYRFLRTCNFNAHFADAFDWLRVARAFKQDLSSRLEQNVVFVYLSG